MTTPEFDPRRSAAIRALLEDVVASTPGGAAGRPRPSRRTTILVVLAVLVGVIASGTTAVALTGGSLFGLGEPVATVAPVTATQTPTPIPTPTPTPTPTAPPAPPAPVVRVPATCDQLLPQSAAEAIVGGPLIGRSSAPWSPNPVSYTGLRVGGLSCDFSQDGSWAYSTPYQVGLLVIPDVSADAFQQTAEQEGGYIGTPEPSIGPDSYSACESSPNYTLNSCSFISHVGGYGVRLWSASSTTMTDEQMAQTRAQFIAIRGAVEALGAPATLWQPEGATLSGASSCDGLIDPAALASILGVEGMQIFKADEGEYAASPFFSDEQVGAYSCSWAETAPGGTIGVFAAVLPGGSSYLGDWMSSDPDAVWEPAPEYPGEAYSGSSATRTPQVAIAIDGGWVLVSAPADALRAVTDVVLANVGATGF